MKQGSKCKVTRLAGTELGPDDAGNLNVSLCSLSSSPETELSHGNIQHSTELSAHSNKMEALKKIFIANTVPIGVKKIVYVCMYVCKCLKLD